MKCGHLSAIKDNNAGCGTHGSLVSNVLLPMLLVAGAGKRFALLGLLSGFNVAFWCTDNFSTYDVLPNEKHITGKLYTQRTERENLNLRNRLKRLNRKTLGYSKSTEMHDRIIGTFIEREHYTL